MGYSWYTKKDKQGKVIKDKHGKAKICCRPGRFPYCGPARFLSPPPGSDYGLPLLAEATRAINEILDSVREQNIDPEAQLSILVVPGGYMLAWTYIDDEADIVITSEDDDATISRVLEL